MIHRFHNRLYNHGEGASRHFQPGEGPSRAFSVIVKLHRLIVYSTIMTFPLRLHTHDAVEGPADGLAGAGVAVVVVGLVDHPRHRHPPHRDTDQHSHVLQQTLQIQYSQYSTLQLLQQTLQYSTVQYIKVQYSTLQYRSSILKF